MRIHFAQIFWGLLLVILDFSINGFDILADGLGYVIVALGCGGLTELSSRFSLARTLCFVLAVLWLIGFVVPGQLAIAYGLGTIVVNCAMVWQLLGGISEFAAKRERPDLAQRAESRRLAYCVIMIGTWLLAMALRGAGDGGMLVLILVVSMLVLMAMILHLIHRVKVELATE